MSDKPLYKISSGKPVYNPVTGKPCRTCDCGPPWSCVGDETEFPNGLLGLPSSVTAQATTFTHASMPDAAGSGVTTAWDGVMTLGVSSAFQYSSGTLPASGPSARAYGSKILADAHIDAQCNLVTHEWEFTLTVLCYNFSSVANTAFSGVAQDDLTGNHASDGSDPDSPASITVV